MLGEALKLMRVFHNLSQKELANKLGISKSHISEIESGKKTPSIPLLERYSEVFDIPLSSIMFFAESMNSNSNKGKLKMVISSKIIALLNFISERSGTEEIA